MRSMVQLSLRSVARVEFRDGARERLFRIVCPREPLPSRPEALRIPLVGPAVWGSVRFRTRCL